MEIAFKSGFWALTCGFLGYALFKIAKPSDETVSQYKKESQHTFAAQSSRQCIEVLKQAANPDAELNKKINDLLKK